MNTYKYLEKHRLTDIISLIQLLALHNNHYLEISVVTKAIGTPDSCNDWKEIANNYPEFFFQNKVDKSISLAIRKLNTQKLSIAETLDLISIATSLHDKEILRKNRNSHFIPLIIAFLTIMFSAFSLIYSNVNLEKSLQKVIRKELERTKIDTQNPTIKQQINGTQNK